jgi:hypothetical protein
LIFHVDGELGDSENNVNEEPRVPSIVTHGARTAKKALKSLENSNGI